MQLESGTQVSNPSLTVFDPLLTPKQAGYRQPAEWEPHESVWLAWPSHGELWQENLQAAQDEFIAFCEAIVDFSPLTGAPRGERLHVLVPNLAAGAQAENLLMRDRRLPVQLHLLPFGDIWLRDTAPVFLKGPLGSSAAVRFAFNGWGGKYDLPHDANLSFRIAEASRLREFKFPWVLEGGSIEVDGQGTCLTSRQCLMNANRNPDLSEEEIEQGIKEAFGVEKVLWLSEGLINDHTDGHIDTIARFAAPGVVMCMEARDADDPNRAVLEKIRSELEAMTDASGRRLKVIAVPSPGAVTNENGDLLPASYLNFYIGNSTIIVPTYGSKWDAHAVREIEACFASCLPARRTVGLSALAILSGGGAFHCISQQQPI